MSSTLIFWAKSFRLRKKKVRTVSSYFGLRNNIGFEGDESSSESSEESIFEDTVEDLQEESDDESKQDQQLRDINQHNKTDLNQQFGDNMSITRSATAKYTETAENQIYDQTMRELAQKEQDKDVNPTSEEFRVSSLHDLHGNSADAPSELQELYAYYQV
jgi:hypothetical protein